MKKIILWGLLVIWAIFLFNVYQMNWDENSWNDGITTQGLHCGDGIQDIWEECDDGNYYNRDWCSDQCLIEDNEWVTFWSEHFNSLEKSAVMTDSNTIEYTIEIEVSWIANQDRINFVDILPNGVTIDPTSVEVSSQQNWIAMQLFAIDGEYMQWAIANVDGFDPDTTYTITMTYIWIIEDWVTFENDEICNQASFEIEWTSGSTVWFIPAVYADHSWGWGQRYLGRFFDSYSFEWVIPKQEEIFDFCETYPDSCTNKECIEVIEDEEDEDDECSISVSPEWPYYAWDVLEFSVDTNITGWETILNSSYTDTNGNGWWDWGAWWFQTTWEFTISSTLASITYEYTANSNWSNGEVPGWSSESCSITIEVTQEECGNNIVEPGEQCDDDTNPSCINCMFEDIVNPVCGDSVLDEGEECDDGNTMSGDGCSSKCKLEWTTTWTTTWWTTWSSDGWLEWWGPNPTWLKPSRMLR